MQEQNENQLKRGLSNRHIQLIALGGAIGTGLFLGVGQAAILAGPAVILGYGIAGIIAFLIMRQLGEMVVHEPVSGSFSYFANRYWGSFAGFASGWNYWILYILVSMAELTAIGKYMNYWWPELPLWVSSLVFFVIINLINLASVKIYGETEFWFSIVKVIAIIGMILFGSYLLISGTGGDQASISNLYQDGGFFPKGLIAQLPDGSYEGLLVALVVIMFSFGGLELVGITAAEAENPEKNIPKATNQVLFRILIFYIGALVILFSLLPWQQIDRDTSPFVTVFASLDAMKFSFFGISVSFSNLIANALNLIVLTAALSVYNSCVYSNSRMLYGLAKQGNAPQFLTKLNKSHSPINAILVSAIFVAVTVVINKLIPEQALEILMSLVVSALVINWIMITLTHIFFRKEMKKQQAVTKFPTILYPFTNYLSLVFLIGVLVMMCFTVFKISVLLMPIWILILWICYRFIVQRKASAE
ncbi:amino acid permease [Sphingobacterium chungjuense]|uniref:amino acid permease n=1 Tax=Sphingobacterium chungjuense TaxID=2675553 RepID=UPI001407B605|nr:amino acid permease [Sphingobacterium chungjuense]